MQSDRLIQNVKSNVEMGKPIPAVQVGHILERMTHLERTLEYFSHTFISPPKHAQRMASLALEGVKVYE